MESGQHPHAADAVADEIDRVLRVYHALSEGVSKKIREGPDHLLPGGLPRHQFHQLHDVHGVEEVGHGDITAQPFRHSRVDVPERDSRCIGGDDGAVPAYRLHPAEHVPLDVDILHDRLADPVAVRHPVQVPVKRTRPDIDQQAGILHHRRPAAGKSLEGGIAAGFVQVQEQYLAAGVGADAGDAGSHGARSEHGDFFDSGHDDRKIGSWSGMCAIRRFRPGQVLEA